mgnify:CR=1 FL=1
MSDVLQVVTTVGSQADAQAIARGLIEQRLAACVQVSGPITSVYRWEGKVETSEEWYCIAKTVRDLYSQVESAIFDLHSYDEPEIIATAVVAGSPGYLDWVRAECTPNA